MDVSVVVPCFNESPNIDLLSHELIPVVEKLRQGRSAELIFVDDGSTDGTGELLRGRFGGMDGISVVVHERNLGLGAAIRTGFEHSSGEVVVTTDADATYPFSLVIPLLDRLDPDTDVVTASCYHPLGGVDDVPGYRVLLSRSASLIYRALLRRDIHTYTCVFRAYRRPVIDSVAFNSNGFLSMAELLSKAILAGFQVAEFPCRLRVRQYGVSKARVGRIVLAHLRFQAWLLAVRARLVKPAGLRESNRTGGDPAIATRAMPGSRTGNG